jgi:hypothetical protein
MGQRCRSPFESSTEAPTGIAGPSFGTMAWPNAASGGRPSRLEVGDFLVRDAHGPQHAELLRLIGTLVDNVGEGEIADHQPRIMSRLQVDGQVVAEIDQGMAG